ncbi:MAG: L,D-transpeptidase family protein [Clostridia bacterium]|nr:L,D-transpeptidase family protein [Clostridia bacterium]
MKSEVKKYSRRIIFIAIAAIALSFFSFASISAYRTHIRMQDEISSLNQSSSESSTVTSQSKTPNPSPSPRAAFIPDPNELQPIPNLEEIDYISNSINIEQTESGAEASWEVQKNADYYVLCAANSANQIYRKEILWPNISQWLIPDTVSGRLFLLCYQDMGEDSTDDDTLITVLSADINVADELTEQTPAPIDENSTEIKNTYMIIVDKADFTFGIFTYDNKGEYTVLVTAFPTAIGYSDRMTPNGTFEISSKGEWKSWSTGSFSPYYTRFTSGLYFHGAVYSSKRNDTMYKSFYNEIGTASSSGCLRTTIEGAKWVYYNCPAGTVVKIVSSSDEVEKVIKTPLDPYYPRWDPTDSEKPSLSPPEVTTNALLMIDEGGSASLTDLLNAVDQKADSKGLIYEIITPPEFGTLSKDTFTQAEINAGEIIYTHDGSDTLTDEFKFVVSNLSSQTNILSFSIKINPVDDNAPEIIQNEWLNVSRGSSASLSGHLIAQDNYIDSSNLIFKVEIMPEHGSIPAEFTQAEITAGKVIYTHDNSYSETDSFIFSVSDGENVLSGQMFSISIN